MTQLCQFVNKNVFLMCQKMREKNVSKMCQCPVQWPSNCITSSRRRRIESTDAWQNLGLTASHDVRHWSKIGCSFGDTYFHSRAISAHTFSIGFKSGDFAGHGTTWISRCSSNHSLTTLVVWMEHLSRMKTISS